MRQIKLVVLNNNYFSFKKIEKLIFIKSINIYHVLTNSAFLIANGIYIYIYDGDSYDSNKYYSRNYR